MTVEDKELEALEKEIAAKSKESKKEAVVVPPPEPPAPESPPEAPPEPKPPIEGKKEEPPPEPSKPESPPPGKEFNAKEWVEKKGWKTPEDAAKSMRDLEHKFHEKSQELAKMRANGYPNGYAPPPRPATGYPDGYAPPPPPAPGYPNYNDPNAYAPPPNPYNAPPAPQPTGPIQPMPDLTEPQYQRAAQAYGMRTEDFKRVYQLQKDMIDTSLENWRKENESWKNDWVSQNERNTDMTRVMSDPSFHIPDVQMEMHEILSKNPSLWNEKRPWSSALNHALINIGRRNITGGHRSPSASYPTAPPDMAGGSRGSGSPGMRRVSGLPSVKDMESKSPEEIEKALKSVGAFKTYDDLA